MTLVTPAAPPPLPYTPCPLPGELLSSWLKRIAAEFGVSLTHLAHHLGLSASTPGRIDTCLKTADFKRVAAATRSSCRTVRAMVHAPLRASVRTLVATQQPIQFCPRCRSCHTTTCTKPVAIKAWFEYWQIECAHCHIPFQSNVKPNLTRSNPVREDPKWFNQILPAARTGAARLDHYVRRPLGAGLAPVAVLNLLSMHLGANALGHRFGTLDRHHGWGASPRVAELFVPGLTERMSPALIPGTWTASKSMRLVDARTILLAAMAAFFADARRAFAQVNEATGTTMYSAIDRWLRALLAHSRELLMGRSRAHRVHASVSHLLQS